MSDTEPGAATDEVAAPGEESVVDESAPVVEMTVEDLVTTLEATIVQRDEYLATAQRLQADFDNFRKRSATDAAARVEAGLGRLADALLPVLDACDAAALQGEESVGAIRNQLITVLEREGLESIASTGAPFDPNLHEAVLHEAGDGGEPTVAEELRKGYAWKGKVLRAAMVKVQG